MKYKFEDIIYNITEKKKPSEEDRLNYIGLEHLDSGSLFVTRWGAERTPEGEKIVMKKGDVLFGKRRAYQKKVAISPIDGVFSAHGMVLRPKEDVICKEFLPFFISSDYFLNEAIRISVGGLSPTINWKDIKVLEFNLPSLAEQKVLAEKLWAAYEVKQSYLKMIEATEEMVKSQFIEMFGNPQTNSQGRKSVRFDEVLTLQRGHDLPEKERKDEGVIPIYGSNGFVGYHTESKAKDGIVTGRSGTIGKVYCIKGDYWPLNTSLYSIDTHGNNLTYLKFMVEAFDVSRFSNGTGVPTLNRNDIHKEMIPFVDVSEQEAFEIIAHQADKSISELRKSIDAIDKVIKSFINENL